MAVSQCYLQTALTLQVLFLLCPNLLLETIQMHSVPFLRPLESSLLYSLILEHFTNPKASFICNSSLGKVFSLAVSLLIERGEKMIKSCHTGSGKLSLLYFIYFSCHFRRQTNPRQIIAQRHVDIFPH